MEFSNIKFEMPKNKSAAIKVVGVGGGGSNAVNYMFKQGIQGVDFIVSNTDAQALNSSEVPVKIQLGAHITEGLGAGANPEVGEQAALESLEDIKAIFDSNTKMAFITAGMGGGTGTGAAPIIASCAKEMGILTVGICTAPFYFEGKMRLEQAKAGIEKFRHSVDSLIIINNDKLRELYGNLGYKSGFAKADEVLATAAKGIAEVITYHYDTNIDLRDARTVLAESGTAIMGSGKASGEHKARKAIELALDSPLLNDNKISGAKNVLLLIVSGTDEITLDEVGVINEYIQQEAGNHPNIIMGIGEDEELGENISVTVIATGFPVDQQTYATTEEKKVIHNLEDEKPLTRSFQVRKNPADSAQEPKDILQAPLFHRSEEDLNWTQNTKHEDLVEHSAMTDLDQTEDKTDLPSRSYEKVIDQESDTDTHIDANKSLPMNAVEQPTTEKPENTAHNTPSESTEIEPTLQTKEFTLFTYDDDWEEEAQTPFVNRKSVEAAPAEETTSPEPMPQEPVKPLFKKPEAPQNSFKSTTQAEVEVEVEEPVAPQPKTTPFLTPAVEPSIFSRKPKMESETDNTGEKSSAGKISDAIQRQIEERRERLKKFNFKFKNPGGGSNNIDDTPAYQRKGVNLNQDNSRTPGGTILETDKDNELKLRPNKYLHDKED
ncbi:MAG: cell division protein FtsZ [Weeksellaceae bacterium]|nr:cell division protein FtsZ [Weeksellaceae bacterium]